MFTAIFHILTALYLVIKFVDFCPDSKSAHHIIALDEDNRFPPLGNPFLDGGFKAFSHQAINYIIDGRTHH